MNEEPEVSLPVRASDQKFCHACAKPIHVSAAWCPSCGAQQQALAPPPYMQAPQPPVYGQVPPQVQPFQRTTADQRHCHSCGNIVHTSASACPKCGAQQLSAGGSLKSRTTAAVLAFFLGGFGAHKFYCGNTFLGIVYLLFFWTWIPALISFVEGIVYLASSNTDEEFTRKFCKQ